MTVGIVNRPLFQTGFLETVNYHFYKLDTITKEAYILDHFNIYRYLNSKYNFAKCLTPVSNIISYDVQKYQEFCNFYSLKQLIFNSHNCSSFTIIDNILASYPDRVSEKRIIDIGISVLQPIFCTRKTLKTKTKKHKTKSVSAHLKIAPL